MCLFGDEDVRMCFYQLVYLCLEYCSVGSVLTLDRERGRELESYVLSGGGIWRMRSCEECFFVFFYIDKYFFGPEKTLDASASLKFGFFYKTHVSNSSFDPGLFKYLPKKRKRNLLVSYYINRHPNTKTQKHQSFTTYYHILKTGMQQRLHMHCALIRPYPSPPT